MEKLELENLFNAIKMDDLKSFSSVMLSNSDLNICFGRFPILSLCYLYGSYKILEKYEKLLLPIHNFVYVDEYYEIYLKFKRYAKKSLKLFVYNDKIVYPIEMLAILDERFLLNKYYKKLYKNEEIVENLQKIYKINKQIEIQASVQECKIKTKKLTLAQKLSTIVCVTILAIAIAFSSVSIIFVSNKFGVGTAQSPIKISTEKELQVAIENGKKCYVLENDITLTKEFSSENFSGSIDGAGYKLVAGEFLTDGFVENLTGSIQNLSIECELSQKTISQNFAILAKYSSGNITNCKISGDFSFETYNDSDVYISIFVSENDGLISNCEVDSSIEIKNNRSSNVFLSAFAGVNDGKVENSITKEGTFEADTVDIGGIVCTNNGEVLGCENNISISQTSSKEWHPNSAGICITNNGTIDSCKNNSVVSAESTLSTKIEDGDVAVICGGIVCDNYGSVNNCRNKGNVVAKGDIGMVYAGGIVARNILTSSYAKVYKSKAECDVEAYSKNNIVCIGGIAGHNSSEVENAGFVGNVKATSDYESTDIVVFAGGVVGYNKECKLVDSYSKVVFSTNASLEETNYFFGGVAGYLGTVNYVAMDFASYSAYGLYYVKNNHYVIDASFDSPAIGTESYVMIGNIIQSNTVQVSADIEKFIAHEKLEDISSEVIIDD